MHLGYIKTGVKVGTVITLDEDTNKLIIDGQVFDSTKDLDIMLKHGWATPYGDKEARKAAEAAKQAIEHREEVRVATDKVENKKDRVLPIIRSDMDDLADIDISHTKKQPKQASEKVDKTKPLPVIRGDEDADAHLKALMEEGVPAVPIIKDDGALAGSGGPSLNSGVKVRTAEEHERLRQEGLAKAKRGFTDPRIADAQKAVDSVPVAAAVTTPVAPARRKPGRPRGPVKKAMTAQAEVKTVTKIAAPTEA